MKTAVLPTFSVALGLLLAVEATSVARAEAKASLPAAAPLTSGPGTFWNLLGIPQATQKLRDARLNRLGEHPEWERVPPPKRIADPENLKSKNPAIKAAAKIKKDQDLAPQKIKAIKYLGEIACCCPTNKDAVKNALLAALDDCTDEVRMEAAMAICHAAGNVCTICNQCSCCTADVMNKLNEMANEQDEQGCWKEPNASVREAAGTALEACRAVRRPTQAPVEPPPPEGPKERRVPTPAPIPQPQPESTAPQTPQPSPAKKQDAPKAEEKPAEKPAAGEATVSDGETVRQVAGQESVGFAVIVDTTAKPAVAPQAAPQVAPKASWAEKPRAPSAPSAGVEPAKLQIKFAGAD